MERLQQLLKQQSLTQQHQQQPQQMLNHSPNSQNFQSLQNSHEDLVNGGGDDEDDTSLQEFSRPNDNHRQQQHQQQPQQSRQSVPHITLPQPQQQIQQKTIHLPQQTPPPMYQSTFSPLEQQQPSRSEFSLRHQSQTQQQQASEEQSLSSSLQHTQQQPQQEQMTSHLFNRKFRQSWRNITPDKLPIKELKKATKLQENDISSQGDDYEEDEMTEDDIYKLHEELENARAQNIEMKTALTEARTIIDQQQNQLTEFRRCAAQYQTDAEAFKMKSMFLLNNSQTHDEQVSILINACERLEAEIDALTWQLDQTKQSLELKTQECHFLNEQLDEIQLNGSYHSPLMLPTDDHQHQHHHIQQNHLNGVHEVDKFKTSTDQFNSMLSTEYKSLTGGQHSQPLQRNTISSELNISSAQDYTTGNQRELQKLREQIMNYEEKEKQWEETHEELLQRQKLLEEEKRQQDLVIGRLANEQATKTNVKPLENNPTEQQQHQPHDEIPAEIIAKLHNLHEEKTTWKLYASSLVRSFVENCDEFIRKTSYNEPYFESDGERRWYTYSMHLLENLLNVAPYLLSKTDLDLLKRTTDSTTNYPFNQTMGLINEPQLLTSSDFPSQVQLRNNNHNSQQSRESIQQQNPFLQGYEPYNNRKSKQSYQQRAARVASKPLTYFQRNKK
ncbi:unnamed protein product [Schistosoma turkestanicum]|nr:unnamed protein product [Schistosoma turkestanicum]